MAIDPKLYEKYTCRRPGDALDRMGQSLAKKSAKGPVGDTYVYGALVQGRWYIRIGAALFVLLGILYFLLAPNSW